MEDLLFLVDSYQKIFTAKVLKVIDNKIYLDKTCFYPQGGGQPCDFGVFKKVNDESEDCEEFKVTNVKKDEFGVAHFVDKIGLREGDEIRGELDWDRRFKIMRMHSAAHCLSAIFNKKFGAKITGNNLDVDKSRIDFDLENFDRNLINKSVDELNELIAEGGEVKISSMNRDIALKDPDICKLAKVLPPKIVELRIVEISGIDRQADGGTHVNNAKEIGKIKILGLENKGKNNRRLYFDVE
jgi:Ser-tRNA(Ala) deacylase AlaX